MARQARLKTSTSFSTPAQPRPYSTRGSPKKLDLHGQDSACIVIVGGRTHGEQIKVPSLELGPVKQSNLDAMSTDLSFFQKTLPIRIDAIVGMDVLGQQPFVIDYSARVIRFGPAAAMHASIPLRLDRGLPVFDAEIDHIPVHLLFDTGASALILFSSAAQTPGVKVDPAMKPDMKPKQIGSFESRQVRLRALKLGAEEFNKEPALLAGSQKPSEFDIDGLMSPPALGITQVAVDLKGGVLAFSR